jgi:hypothetical protein
MGGMGAIGVGYAVVAGVEQSNPSSEIGWAVDDVLAVLEQSLRQRPTGAVAALDRPNPDDHALRAVAHVLLPSVLVPVMDGEVGTATTSRPVPC